MMRRREFVMLMGGAAVSWPLAARAQQPVMPAVGLLEIRSPETITERLRAFRQGLKETGYVEGENIAIEYRWAEQMDQLSDLAAQLVRRQVAVIVTAGGFATALAAKNATTTIPILFSVSDDPVKHGLVAARRFAGRAVRQIRAGHQRANRAHARPRNSVHPARPRRRGDRVMS